MAFAEISPTTALRGRLFNKGDWSGEVCDTGALRFIKTTSDFIAAFE
ncbi:MAG: hypothetical protein AAFY29_15255 [Pseudomonadota bacterium]